MDYTIKSKIEACMVTDMWSLEGQDTWINTGDLTKHNYNTAVSDRQRGGGLAFIYIPTQNIQVLKTGMARSFEHEIWKLTTQSTSIITIAVYHPPYSEKI